MPLIRGVELEDVPALLDFLRPWAGDGEQSFSERGIRWLQWQASPTAVAFYECLGLKGDPCPQPDYPFFEIEFSV